MRNLLLRAVFGCAITVTLLAPALGQETSATKSTLDNLQAAYNGESNAHAKYLEFAKKAQADGYGPVASLFRAAARAEEIHANNHAEVIKKLGAEPKKEIKTEEARTVADALDSAIKGESYEVDTMYPEFLKQAREEKNKDAIKTFNYAKAAEAEHVELYKQAKEKLADWKEGTKEFYVCPVCGKTVLKIDFEKCPVCFTVKSLFEKIS